MKAASFALRVLQLGAIGVVLAAKTSASYDLDRFLLPKEFVLHATAVLATLLAVAAMRRLVITRVDRLLVGFLLLSAVSALLARNGVLAIRALAISVSGMAIFWTARALREAGLARPLLNGIALAVVVGAATSLLQAYGLRLDVFASTRVPGGTLGNRNFVAHMAAFGFPILLLVVLPARRFFLSAIGITIVTAALVLTRSRAAWLAFAVMLLVFLGTAILNHDLPWRRLFAAIGFAGAGVAVALLVPNALHWRSENPYLESVKGVANYEEGSGRGRLVQYERTLRMAIAHPLFGVGPGNWPVTYPRYAKRGDPSLEGPGKTFNPWPSSDWIAFIAERGFTAALLLALAFAGLCLGGLRRDLESAALLATIAAAVVAGLFDAVLLLAVPTLLVWAGVGALTVQQPLGRSDDASRGDR